MFYSIDEIYDLLMWDHQLSEEENEIKAQKGIDAAKHIRNLFPFIQPVIVPAGKSKSIWEPCAKIVAMRSDEEFEPFLFVLLEWMQDLNWPGALIIYNRLIQIPYHTIENALEHSRQVASQRNDRYWLAALDALRDDLTKKA